MKKLLACLCAVIMSLSIMCTFMPQQSYAADDAGDIKSGDCASLLPDSWCKDDNGIINIIKVVIQIMTAGIVVLGTIGMIWCGFLILTARDNESQVASAKKRLIDIIIGILLFVLINFIMNLIFPGKNGIF